MFTKPSTIRSLAAASILALFAVTASADTKLSKPQAGYYRLKVGDVEVTALSDGTVPLGALDLLHGAKPGEIEKLLADSYVRAPLDASVNAFLINAGDRLVMVDAGTSELYGPTLDKLVSSLKAAGYEPDQVTDILITHIHTDHTGGLMHGAERVFKKAVIHVEKKEADFWLTPANKDKAEASKKQYFDQAVAKVQPYVKAGQVKTFSGETQLFPGIKAVPAPGHTPGHTFYVLESKGEKIVFWGDIMHVAEVQFVNPSITIAFDVDPAQAAAARKKAYADAAAKGYLVAPAHVSFPGVGHLRADGTGYRWIPVPYINDAYQAAK